MYEDHTIEEKYLYNFSQREKKLLYCEQKQKLPKNQKASTY